MGTAPQPPRPPAAPLPPRSGSNLVPIVLLILALVVVVSGLAIWTGARYLSRSVQVQVEHGQGGDKDVSIQLPVGKFQIHKQAEVSEARLGLPIYPGAQLLTSNGSAAFSGNDSVAISMDFPGEQNVSVVVGKFDTPDDIAKVKDFYQQRLGNEVTKFIDHDRNGKTVFEIKQDKQERVVALKSLLSGTRIELVRVTHGPPEVN
jgi:hypothetical protein